MTRFPSRILMPMAIIGLVLALASCFGGADASATPTATPQPTEEPGASEPASIAPEPTSSPSDAPASASPAASFSAGGDFTVLPNAEADALFIVRDECTNRQDGYQVEFPEDWYTNTEIARFPACVWFSPTFYELVDETQRPDEIAIEISWVGGDYGWFTEELSREQVAVGTQLGVRAEIAGTPDDQTTGRTYLYVIQLGPTPEEGPNLVARTDTAMGGDYELNKAVLDRMMATIEFIGTTQ